MSVINFYNVLPKEYKDEPVTYPNFDKVKIELPARILIIGASGSGKTNCLMNLINDINCFTQIYLYVKMPQEPLYQLFIDSVREFEKKIGGKIITISSNTEDILDVDEFDKQHNNLVIFDDLVLDKHLDRVSQIYIRGRKNNITPVFISQSFFDTPKMIRQNCNYIIVKRVVSNDDLKLMLKGVKMGVTLDDIVALYNNAIHGGVQNFFMIDLQTTNNALKFRKNFTPIKP